MTTLTLGFSASTASRGLDVSLVPTTSVAIARVITIGTLVGALVIASF